MLKRFDAHNASKCALPNASANAEKHGMLWIVGSFLICPCHLPLTLGLLGMVLGGTAAGVVLNQFPLVAGAIITLAWAAGTLRGFAHLRCPLRPSREPRRGLKLCSFQLRLATVLLETHLIVQCQVNFDALW